MWLTLAGCVIPVAPEFEDAEPNHPPGLFTSTPPVGTTVTGGQPFSVSVIDPNLGDKLYVRWLIDYPPFDDNSRQGPDYEIPAPTGDSPVRSLLLFTPNCFQQTIAQGFSPHQLLLVVADRAFTPSENAPADNPLADIPDGAHALYASWTLELDCSQD